MKVTMLKEQETPKYGVLQKGKTYDLDPAWERRLIARGAAINVSAPDYISKSAKPKKRPKK